MENESGQGDGDRSLAPAVTRAVAVLDMLAANRDESFGPSELGRRLGIAKSSVSNVCHALAQGGLLRQVDGEYCLGQRLVEYGEAYLAGVDLVQQFHAACLELAEDEEETLQLAVLDGSDVVYLARRGGGHPIRLVSEVGRHLPATCTAVGKAMLATLSERELAERLGTDQELPRLTANSVRTRAELDRQLSEIRARGYAVDDEEAGEGIFCLAGTVSTRSGTTAAVSVTLLKARHSREREQRLVALLRTLVRDLAGRLGSTGVRG
ncbi:transcriptional regulator, IclR family [Actinopolyspora alba]|uniref:Transcriptional regulator, IclR family n=1 Tax=Actinopolyspora alba TaxID=673379 RepID=A0A1I2BNI6_9ACTN|nr:IclR family transcriptional regulator [Actinopolyspora alba]SFE57726.1 transcriptional regulator, IclR family [Actinopolyspora alba]